MIALSAAQVSRAAAGDAQFAIDEGANPPASIRTEIGPAVALLPGQTVSVLFLVSDSPEPLFGYSLDIDIEPTPESLGAVSVDSALTNFFDSRNLITAGGATRDPMFSVIVSTGDGGAFVSANTADGATVVPTAGVNDVLAEVIFRASLDALGDFSVTLGPSSALSNVDGFPVPFEFDGLVVQVIPTPAPLALLVSGMLMSPRRLRRRTECRR